MSTLYIAHLHTCTHQVSVSRLEDQELLASLSSSQPGLLKRDREEQEEGEELQEGEPDSKKLNTVEEEREEKAKRIDVSTGGDEEESPVKAVTKLRDSELEASFSSSRSCQKKEEEEVGGELDKVEEVLQTVTPSFSLASVVSAASPVKVDSCEVVKKVKEKVTEQIIGAKELQNEKSLQRKRLNKMLTIFEDQIPVKSIPPTINKEEGDDVSLQRLPSQDDPM